MRRRLERSARTVLKSAAAVVDPMFRRLQGPRILIYHQVGVDLGRQMEVTAENFVKQLDWMYTNGEIVDIESAIERRADPSADRLFVLTFDDGFEDVYQTAFPLMKERGTPFTLYLTTRPIETGEPLDPRYPTAKPFTWDQVGEMIDTGLATIGAHTHTHPDLRAATPNRIEEELDLSNNFIEKRTGVVVKHFAYPWGWWSPAADPFVRDRYETATVGSTSSVLPDGDLTVIGRLPVQSSDDMLWFTQRVKRGLLLENALRRRRANYAGP